MCAAAQRAGRPLKRIRETGHACDHPTDFSDCRYLKCLFAKPSFQPETPLFRRGCVNLRACLCGVKYYASRASP